MTSSANGLICSRVHPGQAVPVMPATMEQTYEPRRPTGT